MTYWCIIKTDFKKWYPKASMLLSMAIGGVLFFFVLGGVLYWLDHMDRYPNYPTYALWSIVGIVFLSVWYWLHDALDRYWNGRG